ncbi:MAG: Hint domain-containing protein [Gemmobacter sp.]
MGTGFRATFVIPWAQTEVDGRIAAPAETLVPGAPWRWTGRALRVDGHPTMLTLEAPEGREAMQRRAARMVRRLVGVAVGRDAGPATDPGIDDDDAMQGHGPQGFAVTDGRQSWQVSVIAVEGTEARLLMCLGEMPPVDTELWVARAHLAARRGANLHAPEEAGVLCFTPGTMLRTATGVVRIEDLHPGTRVQTRDNGMQPVLWTATQRVSGGRMYAVPHLRPVRFRGEAGDLVVSPGHRMLVGGAAARALYNADEVLVAASDLIDGQAVVRDPVARRVAYVHVLMEGHQVVWANGFPTETLYPPEVPLGALDPHQRLALRASLPQVPQDPPVRRCLTVGEAAILRHDRAA